MRQTGCRPQEARTVESRHIDSKNRCMIFERKESKGEQERRVDTTDGRSFRFVPKASTNVFRLARYFATVMAQHGKNTL